MCLCVYVYMYKDDIFSAAKMRLWFLHRSRLEMIHIQCFFYVFYIGMLLSVCNTSDHLILVCPFNIEAP